MATDPHTWYDYSWQQFATQDGVQRAYTERNERRIDERDIVQGRMYWLPSKEELPDRAVRRAHGKGAIEEGIYSHPVVVISQPAEEDHMVHFHLITSLQGKRLDQLYSKSNEFHASRRSWYLPIAPTPDHPDALSKKAKKRFPTLELAHEATLRSNSYVNIRHVYKIDWSLLKPYTYHEVSDSQIYQFERESLIRMLAKGKTLTMYTPGPQHSSRILTRCVSEPIHQRPESDTRSQVVRGCSSPPSRSESFATMIYSGVSSPPQSDFHGAVIDTDRIAAPPPKVPPDAKRESFSLPLMYNTVVHSVDDIVGNIESAMIAANPKSVALPLDPQAIRQPLKRFWVDLKGVTAILIASI